MHGLSLVVASGGCSDGSARASHFGGFSCGARALGVGNFSSRGAHAQLLRSMWNPPGPGIEAMSPARAGGFSTTGPSGESCSLFLDSVLEPLIREAFVDPPPLPLGGSVPVFSSHWTWASLYPNTYHNTSSQSSVHVSVSFYIYIPSRPHGQRSLAGYSLQGPKRGAQLRV